MNTKTRLALLLACSLGALAANVLPAAGAETPKPKTAKIKKAKKPPMVETLRLGCPVRWETTVTDGGKTHRYLCPANKVEVSVLAVIPPGGAYLDGAVKGDKDAGWYR